jgi:hypothetical protein
VHGFEPSARVPRVDVLGEIAKWSAALIREGHVANSVRRRRRRAAPPAVGLAFTDGVYDVYLQTSS